MECDDGEDRVEGRGKRNRVRSEPGQADDGLMSEAPLIPFDWSRAWLDHRDMLPHVRQDGVVCFVTFRLADALPWAKIVQMRRQRDAWMRRNPPPHTPAQRRELRRLWTTRVENLLDSGLGSCVLRDPRCREVMEACLRYDDGHRYRLGTFVLMPNHVHLLVQMHVGEQLGDTIRAWKSVSARRIGSIVGRKGALWMDEYFDHALRSRADLGRFAGYIERNPRHLPQGTYTVGRGLLAC